MSEVFLGQIMLTAFNYAPRGFALCNGTLMSISQNQALFSLLGTQYGGDGITTFALPDLRGRAPLGAGPSADPSWQPSPAVQGQTGGVESVTLTPTQMPPHNHQFQGTSAAGTSRNPVGKLYGTNSAAIYAQSNGAQVPLNPATVAVTGGSGPHENMQPFRVINYCIALTGIFPSRN
ncbi:MAG TPA: tail fiber protein [Lysobacter sp.]